MKNKKSFMCRLTSSILAVLMFVLCFATSAFAQSSDSNDIASNSGINTTIYNSIIDDYLLQTGLTQDQANQIFYEVESSEITQYADQVAEMISGFDKTADYEDNVLFIQENYGDIVHGLSTEDKSTVDKYFLAGALQYYRDYADASEFVVSDDIGVNTRFAPIEPIVTGNDDTIGEQPDEFVFQSQIATRATAIAEVRIFADSTGNASSSNTSGHAWLSVKNISSSNITVGKFSIAPNKTIAMGTWGNKSEHEGLWYSLEAYFISNNSSYTNRASLLVKIDSTALATLTTHITGYDTWSLTNNCSSFAASGWNKICSTTLSAGVINTPSNLRSSIVNTGLYSTGVAVPYDYLVYYANGSNSPVRSTVY